MPHNETVTFPDGTGGLVASCAEAGETEQAKPVNAAADSRSSSMRDFMVWGTFAFPSDGPDGVGIREGTGIIRSGVRCDSGRGR